MTLNDFIFTKEKPARYLRHIAFWVGQCIFWGFWATVFLHGAIWEYFLFQLRSRQFFLLDISYIYIIAYYLLPKFFLNKRKAFFYSSLLLLTVLTYVLFILLRFWANGLFSDTKGNHLLMAWYISMNFITSGPPIVCAMFLVLKMFKTYYIQMQEKLILTRENANAELQLLKAQVHPHFLFNTLNNIYSFSLSQSPQAGILITKLSGMLGYMINECDEQLVLLEKDLKLIEDYMALEKVRYGKRLNMEVDIYGDFENKRIAPLLMIPFIENCFKHGTSQMLQHPWIKLSITIIDNRLFFRLSNGKPSLVHSNKKNKGIGLQNVRKRLRLLYPDKHQLDVNVTESMFTVNLQILLEETVFSEYKILKPEKMTDYAR